MHIVTFPNQWQPEDRRTRKEYWETEVDFTGRKSWWLLGQRQTLLDVICEVLEKYKGREDLFFIIFTPGEERIIVRAMKRICGTLTGPGLDEFLRLFVIPLGRQQNRFSFSMEPMFVPERGVVFHDRKIPLKLGIRCERR